MDKAKSHKDVEFMVEQGDWSAYYNTAEEAGAVAIARSMSNGREVEINVLVSSAAGARWYRGSCDGAEEYAEDPEASVFERIVVRAEATGRVP